MDSQQYLALMESIGLCNQLLKEMEANKDRIAVCMSGALQKVYLEANEQATKEIRTLCTQLEQSVQS